MHRCDWLLFWARGTGEGLHCSFQELLAEQIQIVLSLARTLGFQGDLPVLQTTGGRVEPGSPAAAYTQLPLTCGRGLTQERVRRLHSGNHGARRGVSDGGRIVRVLRLCTVSFHAFRLREHGLRRKGRIY